MSKALLRAGLSIALACGSVAGFASVIGTNKPALDITRARILQLPAGQQKVWLDYLKRSEEQRAADRAALAGERKPGMAVPDLPKESSSAHSMPLDREAAWYGTAEARHIADVIVSFQTPAGGWSKNMDMAGTLRQPGQSYAPDNLSRHPSEADFDTPKDPNWNYVGTLDNDATNTELRFLARVAGQTRTEGESYRKSFLRGLRYLLAAQFPNGGWPQVWPLEGGYHDAITYNDNAVTETADLLTQATSGMGDYAFVPAELRHRSAEAMQRALQCIVTTQIVVHGKRTGWPQQQDPLTLAPESGRNYEPPALATGESADILIYLMGLPHPSPAIRAAVRNGVDWLKSVEVYGQEWTGSRRDAEGRHLVAHAGSGPIWARYYSIETGKPIFGDRDKSLHDDVNELSLERRNGYSWYSDGPLKALTAYAILGRSRPGKYLPTPHGYGVKSSKHET
ncbi:pectate lyase [Granulicella tundricola]|uniref:Pectate lyase n=1 Tax=Granulicella tundricola (strain ATCC BAA-1859 / DSM 23138 / MP5ACTX9) TaxID=1198114 RepID=E8X0C9_GRATM|nr:pectate lyase [Granulicella tundricola]ADW70110.1 pectate lyase [Granulicella tundricola MP5ACTX9]